MQKRLSMLAVSGGLTALSACTSGQSAVVPPSTAVNVTAVSKLQFAVGTANIAGTAGLNAVETFRQTNGLSATLVNTPKITAPAGFVVPADPNVAGNVDSGTNAITGSPQVASGASPLATTLGAAGGAFAYGFAPINSDVSGAANYGTFALPFYVQSSAQQKYVLGPGNAFVPNFRDGTIPNFPGYASGFTTFAVAPVAGTYTLDVAIGTASGTLPSFTAGSTLRSTALLGAFATPAYVSDGAGGGSVTLTVPAGCVEALVYITDTTAGNAYTLYTKTVGTQTLTLPPAIGPILQGVAGATIPVGDSLSVSAVGFDYPAIEASPIGKSVTQTPIITGANGQADLTASAPATFTE